MVVGVVDEDVVVGVAEVDDELDVVDVDVTDAGAVDDTTEEVGTVALSSSLASLAGGARWRMKRLA